MILLFGSKLMLRLASTFSKPVLLAGVLLFTGVMSGIGESSAKSSNLFPLLNGKWRGGGKVHPAGGSAERMSCRVSYSVTGGGSQLSQKLRCVGTDYKFNATANVRYKSGKVSGNWTESIHGSGGHVGGWIDGRKIIMRLRGSEKFDGKMIINIRSRSRHTVNITAKDGSKASIALRK